MDRRPPNDNRIRLRNRHGRTVAHIEHGCLVIQWRERGEKGVATWTVQELTRLMQDSLTPTGQP